MGEMAWLPIVALYVGYAGLGAALFATLYVVTALIWWSFPAKWCWARGSKLTGRLVTDDSLTGQNLNLLAGIQSRREPRWFFGLMLLDNTGKPPRWPRIITKKPEAPHD